MNPTSRSRQIGSIGTCTAPTRASAPTSTSGLEPRRQLPRHDRSESDPELVQLVRKRETGLVVLAESEGAFKLVDGHERVGRSRGTSLDQIPERVDAQWNPTQWNPTQWNH